MDDLFEKSTQYLAKNIVELRKTRGITQQTLAKMASIPRTTLTHIESGSANPTLQNLTKISLALQVHLEELLTSPRGEVEFRRKDQLKVSQRKGGDISLFELIPDPLPNLKFERMELAGDSMLKGVPHLKGTKEYFTCIKNKVEITVLEKTYELKEGDLLAFPGAVNHSYKNPTGRPSVGISIVCLGQL